MSLCRLPGRIRHCELAHWHRYNRRNRRLGASDDTSGSVNIGSDAGESVSGQVALQSGASASQSGDIFARCLRVISKLSTTLKSRLC